MNADTHSSITERVGVWLGRVWRRLTRAERNAAQWLLERGVSTSVANVLIWIVRLTLLASILYFSALLAVLVGVVLVVASIASHAGVADDTDRPEWRDGLLGFGLYDRDGHRIDPHDPDDRQ